MYSKLIACYTLFSLNGFNRPKFNLKYNVMTTLPFNTNDLKPIYKGGLSLFEIEYPENSGEYHLYHRAHNNNFIVVGSIFNGGFAPDFWIKKDDTFTMDQHIEFLYELIYESLINDEELSGLIEV